MTSAAPFVQSQSPTGSVPPPVPGQYQTPYGYTLSYELQGEGAECVLFVMGFLCNRAYWGETVARLHATHPGRYTTCVFDQRGIGLSTDSLLAKYSSRALGRDILGLLLHLGWVNRRRPVHLVGWSMGGYACLEFLSCLLSEVDHSLNICSLVLANTVHKLTLPNAVGMLHACVAVCKGAGSFFVGGNGAWLIGNALQMHFSPDFLRSNYSRLFKEYKERRSPFDKPIWRYFRTLIGHLRVVLTHYVPRHRMRLLRESGLTMHAVVSTDDVLIHPTASINLANSLQCPFSYVKGGHMHHEEHSDDFIKVLVSTFDRGLRTKFPHLNRPLLVGTGKSHHLSSPALSALPLTHVDELSLANTTPKPVKPWPSDDLDLEHILKKLMSRMDAKTLFNIERLRHPGRLILFPLLILPLIVRSLQKVKNAQSTVSQEATTLAYILALLFLVQETARVHG